MDPKDKEQWRGRLAKARRDYEAKLAAAKATYYNEIAKGYTAGLTHIELSVALSMSPNTIRRIMEEMQVQARPEGRRRTPRKVDQ